MYRRGRAITGHFSSGRAAVTIVTIALLAGCALSGTNATPPRGILSISRPIYHVRTEPAKVALWASNNFDNYLFGVDATLNKTVVVIDTMGYSCYGPATVKVDHKRNVWIACNAIHPTSFAQYGGEQEYGSDGEFKRSYRYDASAQCSHLPYCYAESLDGGPDKFGHVFAELSYGNFSQGSRMLLNPGFYWWNKDDRSAPATFIPVSLYCAPFCDVDYMDTDDDGNIWFDFHGPILGNEQYSGGLGEVTHPTTKPSVKVILPPGSFRAPGGVYVSGHGTVLNVTDQLTRETYQYRLPVTPSSTPFNTLGPTRAKKKGESDPISGGFNKDESELALGDFRGAIDVGHVGTNSWTMRRNAYCGCASAAFTPSDK